MKVANSPFNIILADGSSVDGEYRVGKNVVIFSHGFDVQRDSNGLFLDIVSYLPKDFGFVFFDYHLYSNGNERLRTISQQSVALREVTEWVINNLKPRTIHLVAHSMGCKIASLAKIASFDSIIYLAPAINHGTGFRKWFTTHPGATQTDDGWQIERRSGKTTHISKTLFDEQEKLDPKELMIRYAANKPIEIIYALHDRFIPATQIEELAKISSITITPIDADHNFTGSASHEVCTAIRSRLIKHIP